MSIDHTRTNNGNDSNLDILTAWTASDLEALDASDAAIVAAYCGARRAAWDRCRRCPDDVADSDWAEACSCQDLQAMPWATRLLLRGIA